MIPRTSIIRSASSVCPLFLSLILTYIVHGNRLLFTRSLLDDRFNLPLHSLRDVLLVYHQSTWLLMYESRRIHSDLSRFLENIIGELKQRGVGGTLKSVSPNPSNSRQASRSSAGFVDSPASDSVADLFRWSSRTNAPTSH